MAHFVTVAVFTHPHEMVVHRAVLENEGIECFAKDEHFVSVNPFYSNAVGGVKLQVHEGDAERARELLIGSGALDTPEVAPSNGMSNGVPVSGRSVLDADQKRVLVRVLIAVTIGALLWLFRQAGGR
jgi:hypothetical protein